MNTFNSIFYALQYNIDKILFCNIAIFYYKLVTIVYYK